MADTEQKCEDCDQMFIIPEAEAASYIEQGYTLPSRCEECEKRRKATRAEAKAAIRPKRFKRR